MYAFVQTLRRCHELFLDLIEAEREEFAVGRPFYRSRRRRVTFSGGTRNKNPFIGGTRLEWFRIRKTLLARAGSLRCARDYPRADNRLYRFIAGALCTRQWNKSRSFKSKVLFRDANRHGTFPLKLLLARNRIRHPLKFFDAAMNPVISSSSSKLLKS